MDKKIKILIRIIICVVLSILLALGLVFGIRSCNNNGPDNEPSDIVDTGDENVDDGEEEEEWDDWEDDFEDDDWEDEEDWDDWEDEEEDWEDELYYEPLIVNNDEPYLNENFLGFNGVYFQYTHMTHPEYGTAYTEEEATRELDIVQKMGIKIVRSNFSGGMVFKSVGSGADKKWEAHWDDSPYFEAFVKTGLELKKRDIEIMIPFVWFLGSFTSTAQPYSFLDGYFPASITGTGWAEQSGTGYGDYYVGHTEEEEERLLKVNALNYKQFVKDSITHMRARGLDNIKYINGFTECNNAYMENNVRDYDKANRVLGIAVTATHEALTELGLRDQYKFVAPCDNWGGDFDEFDEEKYSRMVNYIVENHKDKVDIIGSHNGYDRGNDYSEDDYYARPNRTLAQPMNAALKAGKEFWIDEYNVATHAEYSFTKEERRQSKNNVASGVALGSMFNGIMNMGGVSNVFIWMVSDQQYPHTQDGGEFDKGVQIGPGFMPNLKESSLPKASWYSYALMQKYIGQGKIIKCNDGADPEFQAGFYYSCIERHDGEITFIVTNYEVFDMGIEVTFMKELEGRTFYRHEYEITNIQRTADAIVPEVSGIGRNVKSGFTDVVKPYSVTVYTTVED